MPRPALGRIHHVILELASELGKLLGNLLESLLFGRREINTGQAKIPQGILDNLALGIIQPFKFGTLGQALISLEQSVILTHLGGVSAQQG